MKIPRSFNRNRILPHLRIATVVMLISGAAALAFVATTNNVLTTGDSSPSNALRHRLMKQQAQYGLASRSEASEKEGAEDPTAAAAEDYANRAYPAAYVPFQLTVNAQNAWKNI